MDNDPTWTNLVLWLRSKGMNEELLVRSEFVPGAGRGLFTTRDVPVNTPLFTVPKSAHMNLKTLRPLYASISVAQDLTAIQMISMHIFLHRPDFEHGENSCDPAFGPYISILPQDFQGHPLTWRIRSRENTENMDSLISFLPAGVDQALKSVEDRFWDDWKVVSELLSKHTNIAMSTRKPDLVFSPFTPELHVPEFLWAWLNVNTRCVYHRISASPPDSDNITLCPLLDLANHTSDTSWTPHLSPIPTFFSPANHSLKKGQEVYLRYGSHANATLFVEYGFVEAYLQSGGQADVQEIITRIFHEKGSKGEWMRAILVDSNYWGDWKLYESPSPAHPSYRILPALRLLHLSLPAVTDVDAILDDTPEMETWQETIRGDLDLVSPENEERVWETLEDICRESVRSAEERHCKLERKILAGVFSDWMEHAAKSISTILLEEKRVSHAVLQSILLGEARH